MEVCPRNEILSELDAEYQAWGAPATYQRFFSIEKHLKMLADLRGVRGNQKFADDD